ncbi:dihydrofolate reductase family protein [Agreia sp. COWG]|uniref:dihydrofolate reductase family protein n=1 Tax=Agreia sp. COWG TaxID=2773266 RepID=UPI00192777BB|nr:dihydrofolate reductase family protein [Agreia sp. COWG]CAD5992130.1 Dihydrofolate reductase [Agreia sp. COWG]
MAQLLYSAITSLDGYSADAGGDFSWGAPDEEVHAAINEQQRSIGTYLYGRRMYEIMRFWESEQAIADDDPIAADYGRIWRAADKVVYSATLAEASTQHTRIERSFQPAVVERLKREAVADLSIAGATIAAAAFEANLIDEVSFYVTPIVVGGGLRALPTASRRHLVLLEQRSFGSGVVFLRYRPE